MFSAPVTAIKILPIHKICFAGTGPYVLAFDLSTNRQLLQEKILTNSTVHGFEICQTESISQQSSYIIVVFGQRSFSIIQWNSVSPSILTTIQSSVQTPCWILSALIIRQINPNDSPTILFSTALNQIYCYDKSLVLIESLKYTTLYSSCLFYHKHNKVIFACGTVFGELILYEQNSNDRFYEKLSKSDHNGAIFGITYYENLLSTVGDDRTVKLYKLDDTLQLISSFFAHEARIWQSSLTSTQLLTCGEDSSIRLWSHKSTGELLRCFTVHRCKSVWSMDILRDDENNKPLIVVSGWSDGGVRRYHVDDLPIDPHEHIVLNNITENDFPRNVLFLNTNTIIAHMNSGQLLKIDKQNQKLFYDGRNLLQNGYAKMTLTNDVDQCLAVGSLDGCVLIFDQDGTIKNQFQIDTNKNNKILQILWLNKTCSTKLLVCIPDGLMFIYNIKNQPATIEHYLEVLPDFEQRWPNTCLYIDQHNLLFIGDRQGNILSYDLNQQFNCSIYQKFERLHGINGTSFIDIDPNTNLIRSCGRDGYINIFSIDINQRRLIHQSTFTITSDIAWLDKILNSPLSLVTCFTTNFFCLYTVDEQTKRKLMQIECGGGHRNHDFIIDNDSNAYFVYVRNKRIYLTRKNLLRILNESTYLSNMPATHGTEIRCIKLFELSNQLHMITGSEDTQMKLFQFRYEGSDCICENISNLQSHLSAVCDIITIDNFIFSCGARAQLFAWQIKDRIVIRAGQFMLHPLRRRHGGGGGNINDDNKKETNDDDHGLDVRFTSVAAISLIQSQGCYLLFVTGSDATLRVFRYTIVSNRFQLIRTLSHSEYCQLRVKVYSDYSIVFVSSTDGYLCAYDVSSFDNEIRTKSIKIHQSGINDFDLIKTKENNLIRLATVGDDGSVNICVFDTMNWSWNIEYENQFAHQSPATGIRFMNSKTFLSIGIDQRVKLWIINTDENKIELRKTELVDIRDILSMDTISCDKNNQFIVAIAGAGVQTFRFDLMNCFFHF